jgi:DNA polymerase III subunit beta
MTTTAVLPVNALQKALKAVQPAVAGKSTLPVLSCVLFKISAGRVAIHATDLEKGLILTLEAQTEIGEHPDVCIPFKLLSDVVGSLSPRVDETVTITTGAAASTLRHGKSKFSLATIEGDEFPVIPSSALPIVALPRSVATALNGVTYAAAQDDSRPVLAGINFTPKRIMAADGYRLAIATFAEELPEFTPFIVAARAIDLLLKLIVANPDGEITMQPTESQGQMIFTVGNATLVSRLIEGKYPDVMRVVPSNTPTVVKVLRENLLSAAKQVKPFSAVSNNVMRITVVDGTLLLQGNAASTGEASATCEAKVVDFADAKPTAGNNAYFVDIVTAMPETITVGFGEPTSPILFCGDEGNVNLTAVLMPMSVR